MTKPLSIVLYAISIAGITAGGCSSAGSPETLADVQQGGSKLPAAEVEALTKLAESAGVPPAKLAVLNASGGSLAKAPNGFLIEEGHVSAIKLSGTKLSTLESLGALQHLKGLSLANNRIEKIGGLEKATGLLSLDISKNQLTTLEGLSGCKGLRGLKASHNALRTTKGLEGTAALRTLMLDDNELTDLAGVAGHENLVTLDLTDNALTSLEGLSDLALVRVIRVSENNLTTAAGLGALPELEELYLDRNELTTLGEFPELPDLVHLDLSQNQLSSLPARAAAVKGLILNGNPLSAAAREAIVQAAPRCTGNARAVKAAGPRGLAPLGCHGSTCAKNFIELSKRAQLDLGRTPFAKQPFEVRITTEYGSAKVIVANSKGRNVYAQAWPGRPCVLRGAKAILAAPAKRRRGIGRRRGPQKLAVMDVEVSGHRAKVVTVEIGRRLEPLDDVLGAAPADVGEMTGDAGVESGDASTSSDAATTGDAAPVGDAG